MIERFYSYIPIRTVSEANLKEHWSKSGRRHKMQKKAVWLALMQKRPELKSPCEIVLTRVAPREFDFSNLVSSFKWIEDACAEYIHPGLAPGRADSDKGIHFTHAQLKGMPKEYAIEIKIYC